MSAMLSVSVSVNRCRLCLQLGFPPDRNWHPDPQTKQQHVCRHLRADQKGLENATDAQLTQHNQFDNKGNACFPQQNRMENESQEVVVCCGECGVLIAKEMVFVHWRKRHSEKKRSEPELGQHNARMEIRKKKTQKKHECQECAKGFLYLSHLLAHQRGVHRGERPFPCLHCQKSFKGSSSLKVYQRAVHQMGDPLFCDQCGKSFGCKGHIWRHWLAIHLHLNPFQCPTCQKSFAHKATLKRHKAMVHEKRKPFECRHCGKSFGRKSDLQEHQRVHTGEKPFGCEECGARFTRSGNKRRHEDRVHKKPPHSE